ncbi:hypothetical protein EIP91_010014, partial [Steccherinum ochraceum]
MDFDPRPPKRPRLHSQADFSQPLRERMKTKYERGDLWLDDGNIVLVAEGTAFRVHQSILSRNSEVFRDMFTLPQPEGTETCHGCPVVHLQDSKKELLHVLLALFDGINS